MNAQSAFEILMVRWQQNIQPGLDGYKYQSMFTEELWNFISAYGEARYARGLSTNRDEVIKLRDALKEALEVIDKNSSDTVRIIKAALNE